MHQLLVGTFAKNREENGLYATGVDAAQNRLVPARRVASLPSASYMAADEGNGLVYVADEARGGISAWPYTNWGAGCAGQVNSGLAGLCHLALCVEKRLLFAAAYTSGCVESRRLPLSERPEGFAGRAMRAGTGPVAGRQQSAHPHSAALTPDKTVLCVCDLGTDELACYAIQQKSGMLVEKPGWGLALPPGSGPRHMVFAPNGENAYLLSELSRQVFHLRYSGQTGFSLIQAVSLPETNPHPSREIGAAALRITKDGRFLYASNRGDDSIVCIKILPGGGLGEMARYEAGGQHPRDFVLCGQDSYLVCACRFSGRLTLFSRNSQNGALLLLDTLKDFSEPVCILEVPG